MASNLADKAGQLADAEVDENRKREFEEAIEACRRVPYFPARTFFEGLQSCRLIHIPLLMEDIEQGMSFGRLDKFLPPLYEADLRQGRITPRKAAELIAHFGLKTCETLPLYSNRIDKYFSGNGVAQGITLGGLDENGNDVTNPLSALFLDGYAQIRTKEPALQSLLSSRSYIFS